MRCGVLHRLVFVTFAAAILYGGGSALASEAATAPAESPPPLAAPGPLAPDGSVPAPAKAAPAQRSGRTPQAPDGPGEAHIALLLPLESPSFARHAEAVKNGFLAAAKVQGSTPLPLRIYAVNDDDRSVVEQYQRALEHGARFIVGPLTRGGVSALAESALVMVPTIALNVPERRISRQSNLYMLSLHAEAEAQQAAQFAYQGAARTRSWFTAKRRCSSACTRRSRRNSGGWAENSSRSMRLPQISPSLPASEGRWRRVLPTWRFSPSTSRARGLRAPIWERSRSMPPRTFIPATRVHLPVLTLRTCDSSTCHGSCSRSIPR